ncbi:MAG: hypothetical protein IJE97_03530, partial [Thermoguttaceae bacterium]|nr:hypothetical protein [Thermoguttaceae bacterium]
MATSQAAQKQAVSTTSDVRREHFRVVGAPETPSSAPNEVAVPFESTALSGADSEALSFARDVLLSESRAILNQIERLDRRFCAAVELLTTCAGSVVVTGMG